MIGNNQIQGGRQVVDEYFPLGGGLDLVSSPIAIAVGKVINGVNFEPWMEGGYRRMLGFECYDGRTAPTDAVWYGADLVDATGLTTSTVLTGDVSGASGTVVAISSNAICLTAVTGTFTADEDLNTAAYTLDGSPVVGSAPDSATQGVWQLAAEDHYRALIGALPGSGDVRGIWQIRDRIYGFRDNAGATACIPHKATASGWDPAGVTLAYYVMFDTGTVEPAVGDTLDGFSSSASATIHKVVVHSGTWGGSDAKGYIVLTGITGTFTSGENLQVSAATKCVATANSAQHSFDPGGRFDFVSHNFFANTAAYRVYGADGVNPAFEIDESDIISPIFMDTSLTDAPEADTPFLVCAHRNYFWLAFTGGSLQHSIVGDPLTFNGFLGAADYGLGEEITSITSVGGNVLVAQTRRQTHGFYQGDTNPWNKQLLADRSGAILYTAKDLGSVYSQDDSGITETSRVQEFGDFANATISDLIQPYLESKKTIVAGSMVVRKSNQYRVLYTDGTAIIGRLKRDKTMEFMPMDYGIDINVCYDCDDNQSAQSLWFGGSDGFVYRAERGNSFNGANIESFVRLPFNHQNTPGSKKRYRLAELEIEGSLAVNLTVGVELNYADGETSHAATVLGGGGFYNEDDWNDIYWDSAAITSARLELTGSGQNIGMVITNDSATTAPFILQGVTTWYDGRRRRR